MYFVYVRFTLGVFEQRFMSWRGRTGCVIDERTRMDIKKRKWQVVKKNRGQASRSSEKHGQASRDWN